MDYELSSYNKESLAVIMAGAVFGECHSHSYVNTTFFVYVEEE